MLFCTLQNDRCMYSVHVHFKRRKEGLLLFYRVLYSAFLTLVGCAPETCVGGSGEA